MDWPCMDGFRYVDMIVPALSYGSQALLVFYLTGFLETIMAVRCTKTDTISLDVAHVTIVRTRFDQILSLCQGRDWLPTYVNVMALAFIEAKDRILSKDKSMCLIDELEFQCFLLLSKWTYNPIEVYLYNDVNTMCIVTSDTISNVSHLMAVERRKTRGIGAPINTCII